MSLATAIADRLAGDATLTALLAVYRGQPAVIVIDDGTMPENVKPPFVAVVNVAYDEADDCKIEDGRDQICPVRPFTKATGSTALIEQICERIRFLLHRKPAGLLGNAWMVECSISPFPTDRSLYGRQVDVRVMTQAPS